MVNLRTPREVSRGESPSDETFCKQVRQTKDTRSGVTIERYLKMMDAAGIERSLLIAVRAGDLRVKGSVHIAYERVAEICKKYPDRFSGLAGVDPTLGMQQLRELEHAVKELGFVGSEETGEPWLPESKKDRDEKICCSGWT